VFSNSFWLMLAAFSQAGQLDLGPTPPTPPTGPAIAAETGASPRFESPDTRRPPRGFAAPAEPSFSAPLRSGLRATNPALDTAPSARPEVASATAEEPLDHAAGPPSAPAVLLRQALAQPERMGLEGRAVSLRQVLERNAGSQSRQRVVTAYWRLCHTVAAFQFASAEAAQAANLPAPQARHQQAVLAAVQAAAKARLAETRLAAIQAQEDLLDAGFTAPDQSLPLPTDPPFTGAYRTNFETLRSRGAAPESLRRIDRTLPAMHELLDVQAAAALTTAEALSELERAYAGGQVDLNTVLETFRRLGQQRRDFLDSVRGYNEAIANYALSIAAPALTHDRIVAMLIATAPTDQSVLAARRTSSGIQRVSGQGELTPPEGTGFRAR
jgi:hypothetical protein